SNLFRRESFCSEQARRKNVHVAVPETGGNDAAFAVNDSGMPRDLDRGRRSDGQNASVAQKNCTVVDGRFSRRGIDLCVNQSEVRTETGYARREGPNKKDDEGAADPH